MIGLLSRLVSKATRSRPTTHLRVQALEDRAVPAVIYAVGAGEGGGPRVKVFNEDSTVRLDFFAYEDTFRGGVRVATGDFNGDGQDDIVTAPGNGGGPLIRVFDGNTGEMLQNFFAYDPALRGGAWVAAGDMDGDGQAEIATGAGNGGGPHVKVYDGATVNVVREFMAYEDTFRGGVRVAAGSLRFGQPVSLITSPGDGGGPLIRAFDGLGGGMLWQQLVFDGTGRSGVYVSIGDVTGDGVNEVFVGQGRPLSSEVRVLQAINGRPSAAYPDGFSVFGDGPNVFGVRLRAVDLDADGLTELLAGEGPGGSPEVRILSGTDLQPMATATAFEEGFQGGIYLG